MPSAAEMAESAKRIRPDFEKNWQDWSVKKLAKWWNHNYMDCGHNELGQMLMEVTGSRAGYRQI